MKKSFSFSKTPTSWKGNLTLVIRRHSVIELNRTKAEVTGQGQGQGPSLNLMLNKLTLAFSFLLIKWLREAG